MEACYLQDIREGLQGHILPCEESGEELERSPYAITTILNLRGLKCAGKEIFPSLYQRDPRKFSMRFAEECRVLAQLAHPNIVQFLGVYVTPRNAPLVVMEHLPLTLGEALDQNSVLQGHLCTGILTDIALALRYLHERVKPVVHRDFNANNILLTDSYRAKLADLGIAKITDMTISKASRLSKVPGTLCYMAPEVLVNNPKFDTSSNVFSYGALILHVLSAQWPLPTEATMLDPNLQDKLIPVSEWDRREEFANEISDTNPLKGLAQSCLSNNPSNRPKAVEIWNTVAKDNPSSGSKGAKIDKVTDKKPPSNPAQSKFKSKIQKADTESRASGAPRRASYENQDCSQPETRVNYENQVSLDSGKFSWQRSSESSSSNRGTRSANSTLEREKPSSGTSVADRIKQAAPPVAEKAKLSHTAEKGSSSVLKNRQLFDVKENGDKNTTQPSKSSSFKRDGKDSILGRLSSRSTFEEKKDTTKELKDKPAGRLSSSFPKSMFEEQQEKEKPENESQRPRVNSSASTNDSVSKLTKMFTTINESQPAMFPKTAPKPTKSSRWRSQQEVESQMKAATKATTSVTISAMSTNEPVQQDDSVDEIYDSYVDMTPKVLEEESKVRIFAKVIYDYEADDEDELSITEGETVEVVDIQEHDDLPQWWLVRKGELFGNIPSTYVQIIKNPQTSQQPQQPKPQNTKVTTTTAQDHAHRSPWQQQASTTSSSSSSNTSTTPSFLRNRSPSRSGNKRGGGNLGGVASGFGSGKANHRASIFVNLEDFKSRRKTVEALFGPQSSTTVATPTPAASMAFQATPQATPKAAQAAPQPCNYVALYDFSPNSRDEIGFIAGDHVVDAYDLCEGWLVGTIVRTGQRGNVPKTYFRT